MGAGTSPGVTPAGTLGTSGSTAYDMATDLGLSSAAQSYMYAEFDHLIPIVPNIKYEKTTLTYKGTATQTVTIGTQTISAAAASNFSWDNEDVLFYWGVPFSTWIPMIDAADFGFGVKLGNLNVGVDGVSSTAFPMGSVYGYGRLHISPPLLFGLGFEIESKYISASDTSGNTLNFSEMVYKVDWMIEAPIPIIDLSVGVEAGYRAMTYEITASGAAFNLDFSGIFFGVVGKFGI